MKVNRPVKIMRYLTSFFLFACLLCTAHASAGVLYSWHMTQPSATIYEAGGLLELTEEAVQAGQVTYAVTSICEADPCIFSDPSSPILRFEFWTNGARAGAYVNPITGSGLVERFGESVFNVSFLITGDRINDFTLTLSNFDTTMTVLNGEIGQIGSDWPGCYSHCTGSSGFFQAVNVPEPGSLALTGLGMLGLAYRLRRASRLAAYGMMVVNR